MKKLSVEILTSFLVLFCALFITLLNFKDENFGFVIGAGAASIMAVCCVFLIIRRVSELIKDSSGEKKRIQLENNQKIENFCLQLTQTLDNHDKEFSERITNIGSIQEKLINDNNNFCKKIENNIESLKIASLENYNNILDLLGKQQETINTFFNDTEKIMTKNAMTFRDSIRVNSEAIADSAKNSISNLDNAMEKQIEILSEAMEKSNAAFKAELSEKYNQFHKNHSELSDLIKKFTNTSDSYINSLNEENKKHIIMLENSLEESNKKFKNNIIEVNNNNTTEIIQNCRSATENAVTSMFDENQKIAEFYRKEEEKYINSLSELYCQNIHDYMHQIEEKTEKLLAEISAENHAVFSENNEKTSQLINTENNFINSFTENNEHLKNIIKSLFENYNKSVQETISDFKTVLLEQLETNSRNSDNSISEMTEKLRDYSDSFVEKSAAAIANVQADNNLKLQQLSDSLNNQVQENIKFIENCKDVNSRTNENIGLLITENNKFTDKLNNISENAVNNIDKAIQADLEAVSEKLSEINIKNAGLFSDAMENYREKFVTASAEAIANVQGDNLKAAEDAQKKIAELSEKIKKNNSDMVIILTQLDNIINSGIDNLNQANNKFYQEINDITDEKLDEYNDKIEEYNRTFEDLSERITEIINACRQNTESYEKTLEFITECRKEENSLNKEDIQLLSELIKR